ncbi:hypothetical protein ACP4OV_000427 [Aristida adscensionis]
MGFESINGSAKFAFDKAENHKLQFANVDHSTKGDNQVSPSDNIYTNLLTN